jgi:hypothetical protein
MIDIKKAGPASLTNHFLVGLFGGLFPLPVPEGLPVFLLGAFAGVLFPDFDIQLLLKLVFKYNQLKTINEPFFLP